MNSIIPRIASRICLLIVCSVLMQAQNIDTLKTGTQILGGIGIGNTYHTGGFKGLPGIESCCTTYPAINALSTTGWIGIEKSLHIEQYSLQGAYGIKARYIAMNAPFFVQEYVGNVITGNALQKALIDFSVDASIHYLSIEPQISLSLSDIPVFLYTGISAGIPIKSSVTQQETIVAPELIYFSNGRRVQHEFQGSLPNVSSLVFTPFFGIGADIPLYEYLSLRPSLEYRIQLNPVVQNLSWKHQSFFAECGLAYSLHRNPEPVIIPIPKDEPIPMPELTMHFHGYQQEVNLGFGDTIQFPYSRIIRNESSMIHPVFVFADQSSHTIIGQTASINECKNVLQLHSNKSLLIAAHAHNKEAAGIAQARAQKVKTLLESSGIVNPIEISTHTIPYSSIRYPELIPESRKVIITFKDGTQPIQHKSDTNYLFERTDLRFVTEPSIMGARIAGLITLGKSKTMSIEEPDVTFTLTPDIAHPLLQQKLIAQCYVNLDSGLKAKSRIELYVKPLITNDSFIENEDIPGVEEHMLGYCDFDEVELYGLNTHALERINQAQKLGKSITIIPLTDDLGKGEHNKSLAEKRVARALTIIANYDKSINTALIQNGAPRYLHNQNDLLNRMMHRGVMIQIQ